MAPPGQTAAAVADLLPDLDPADPLAPRGLQAYQANGHAWPSAACARPTRSSRMMLGSDNFNALARDLWHRHPPTQGDLARWGDAPARVSRRATSPGRCALPGRRGPRRMGFAPRRHRRRRNARPGQLCPAGSGDATGLTLTLAPGTELVSSRFPVATLVMSHRFGEPGLAEAAQKLHAAQTPKLPWSGATRLRPRLCAVVARSEAALLQAIARSGPAHRPGRCAGCGTCADTRAFDFTHWLTQAVSRGLVTGVHDRLDPTRSSPGSTDEPHPALLHRSQSLWHASPVCSTACARPRRLPPASISPRCSSWPV